MMYYGHSPDKARAFGEQANALIDKATLPRRPDIYELFYIYVSGHLPEVVRSLDKIYAKGLQPNDQDCNEIYKMHVSDSTREQMVLTTSDKVAQTITDVRNIVGAIQEATVEYGGSLGNVNDQLSKANSIDDVADLLKSMMADTAEIIAKNKTLEGELEKSSTAVLSMQAEIDNVRREALTDALTGLGNRKHFDRKLQEVHRAFVEQGKIYSLLVMDIDHFKSFNDTYGHQVGDRVLKLLGRVLSEHLKPGVFAARYGGEEFVVIAEEAALDEALVIAESVRNGVATKDIVNKSTGERLGRITVSVGVGHIGEGEHPDALVERTDKYLYAAKKSGRNQVKSDADVTPPAVPPAA